MTPRTERLSPLQLARDLRDDGIAAKDVADDRGLVRELIGFAARHDLRLSRMPLDFEAIRIALIVLAAPALAQARAA